MSALALAVCFCKPYRWQPDQNIRKQVDHRVSIVRIGFAVGFNHFVSFRTCKPF